MTRRLYFYIRLVSAEGCPCKHKAVARCAVQWVRLSPAGKVLEESFHSGVCSVGFMPSFPPGLHGYESDGYPW
jgi:hypothetical protein